jgi:hypothetical protein
MFTTATSVPPSTATPEAQAPASLFALMKVVATVSAPANAGPATARPWFMLRTTLLNLR